MKLILILLFSIANVYGDSLTVKVNPIDPVYNEPFSVNFIIKTDKELTEEPVVSFDPMNAEVVSKSDVSTSTQFSYINGASSVVRTYTISYDLIASNPGNAYIRSIFAEVDGKKIRHKTIQMSVLKNAKSTSKIFVQAEVNKQEVFAGESIVVRYYIYSRNNVPVTSLDIKKFPKLDKFLKRFHQEKSGPERVRYRGQIYVRRIMYTAQLFAETPGLYKIDPITMIVKYTNRSNSFGGFGLGLQFGKPMSTTVVSKPVEINVLPLPVAGMPPTFSGLVGKYTAQLKMNKNRFIANEPIEFTLSLNGNGAMELYEAPALIEHSSIEEFEKNSDLAINEDFTAVKKVNYTYLGRESIELKDKNFEFSYFDPELKEFKTIVLPIGSIKIAGGLPKTFETKEAGKKGNEKKKENPSIQTTQKPFEFKPLFKVLNTYLYTVNEIFIVLITLLLLSILGLFYKTFKSHKPKTKTLYEDLSSKGLSFQNLHKIFKSENKSSLFENIEDANISNDAKKYLLTMAQELQAQYKENGEQKNIPIKKSFLKEIKKII